MPPGRLRTALSSILLPALPWWIAQVLILALMHLKGWSFEIPWEYHQLLARPWLQERLGESLLHLHAQPPLLNLGLGLALALESLAGIPASTSLFLAQIGAALLCTLFLSLLARERLPQGRPRLLFAVLVLAQPAFHASVFQWFYTLHEACLLAAFLYFASRYLSAPRPSRFLAASLPLVLLSLERSLFHPLFTAGGLLALLAAGKAWKRKEAAIAVLCLALSAAWPAKNLWLFGSFTTSSWRGYNMARGLHVQHPPILYAFQPGDSPLQRKARAAARNLTPEEFRNIPALAEPLKAPGTPNWNQFAMLAYGKTMEKQVLDHLWKDPQDLFRRATHNYLRGFGLHAARNPYNGNFEGRIRTTWVRVWARLHEALVFLGLPRDPREGLPSGFALAFPWVLAWILVRAFRAGNPEARRLLLLALYPVLWVLLLVLLVDGQEGNRMRLSGEALFWFALLFAFGTAKARRSPLRTSRAEGGPGNKEPGPAPP